MSDEQVTPEWLLSHGFVQYKSTEEGKVFEIPFMATGWLHFLEKTFSRQMFVVIIEHPPYFNDDPVILVYVQEDAGCGFVEMPLPWIGLPVKFLQSLYYSFHEKYL